MNETTTHLEYIRENLYKRLIGNLLVSFFMAAVSFGVSYFIYSSLALEKYLITNPVVSGNVITTIVSAVFSQLPCTISLVILFFSSFTIFCRPIAYMLCIKRGLSAGCFTALAVSGNISGLSHNWSIGLLIYIISTILFLVLVSLTVIYSHCICRTYSTNEKRISMSLGFEWLRFFLPISGTVYITGLFSVLFI